ncbi:ATP phosphoribosyltransferase [Candidatus Kirkpatrickella diaphorinae]|uniref:ATP phosphoribosyltransferase n=1 Tax=Candidatus Kirkpatrickella diaphorinae TaxID=2984322 RepID=A0ABY6GJV4_9PROT|nr:ATP phosphoribosyltransferase [Candidatus Kirkpatrickella diaphorinae]UYH51098.1 ATP phosphoribosyltransferase [Candidatus Kirkpatrickella diaphorinae]
MVNDHTILAPAISGRHGRGMILALPKGRILKALKPLLHLSGLLAAPSPTDEATRALRFPTTEKRIDIVRVRSFDVATFVAHGGADIGICGSDVLMEFDYPEIYAPLDLEIGQCRISVARGINHATAAEAPSSKIRIATKYPAIARQHFAQRGMNAEIVHLHGAMELAPSLNMAHAIVDLVDTGATLRANGLEETEVIAHVSSRLIVNRVAMKTRPQEVTALIDRFRDALRNKTQ